MTEKSVLPFVKRQLIDKRQAEDMAEVYARVRTLASTSVKGILRERQCITTRCR